MRSAKRARPAVGPPNRVEPSASGLSGGGRATADAEHQAAIDWLAAHPEALSAYEDQWVALAGGEIVGHGPSVIDAFQAAKERGYDDPLLVPVLPADVAFAA
jgi:hypothetical protein